MNKVEALKALEVEMEREAELPLRGANLVFGEGSPDAAVCFIGEAPGMNEDLQKRPFVGRAGQLLNKLIEELGWKRSEVYITNIVKRRPPDNRDPSPEEIEAYRPYLARQLEILRPKIIAPLGRFSMNYFLPTGKISRDQGKLFRVGDYLVYPMFHPAAALRGTGTLTLLRGSFTKLPDILTRYEELSRGGAVPSESKSPSSQKTLFSP
ncbi:MAG: uracil-DNA glycosylase [Candidatus Brennerbacteria bacterium]